MGTVVDALDKHRGLPAASLCAVLRAIASGNEMRSAARALSAHHQHARRAVSCARVQVASRAAAALLSAGAPRRCCARWTARAT